MLKTVVLLHIFVETKYEYKNSKECIWNLYIIIIIIIISF